MPYPPTNNPSKHDALHLPISRHTKRRDAHSAVRARGPSVEGIVSPNDLACWPEEIRTRLSGKWSRRLIDVTYPPLFVLWVIYNARREDGGRCGFSIRAFAGLGASRGDWMAWAVVLVKWAELIGEGGWTGGCGIEDWGFWFWFRFRFQGVGALCSMAFSR